MAAAAAAAAAAVAFAAALLLPLLLLLLGVVLAPVAVVVFVGVPAVVTLECDIGGSFLDPRPRERKKVLLASWGGFLNEGPWLLFSRKLFPVTNIIMLHFLQNLYLKNIFFCSFCISANFLRYTGVKFLTLSRQSNLL